MTDILERGYKLEPFQDRECYGEEGYYTVRKEFPDGSFDVFSLPYMPVNDINNLITKRKVRDVILSHYEALIYRLDFLAMQDTHNAISYQLMEESVEESRDQFKAGRYAESLRSLYGVEFHNLSEIFLDSLRIHLNRLLSED